MKFDAQRAYHHITQLVFPRAVGSRGESKARDYIAQQFAAIGLTVVQEPFDFTLFPAEILPRLIFMAFTGSIFAVCWISPHQPIVASLLCAGMALITLILTHWQKRLEGLYNVGRTYTSKNIIATSPPSPDAIFDLIFVAHYDSKSQVLPIAIRALCYGVAVAGLAGLTLLALIQIPLAGRFPPSLMWAIGGVICFCLILLQFNFTQNRSPGAFDNASGVGVLLELARCLSQQPLSHRIRLTFLSSGAEEYGMCGALRYIQRHAGAYDPDRTYVVNLDSLGVTGRLTLITRYGIPPVETGKGLGQTLVECGREVGVEISEIYSPTGIGYDQLPIASRGFETVTLSAGGFGRAALKIHSKQDKVDLIAPAQLQRVGDVLVHFVAQLNNQRTKGK